MMNIFTKQLNKIQKQWVFSVLSLVLAVSVTIAYAQEGPVLEMTSYSSKLLKPDLTPNVSIYADGTIKIYHANYMKNSGLYKGQLSKNQLDEVNQLMNWLEQFDSIKAEENYVIADLANKRLTGQLYYSSEIMITQFRIIRNGKLLTGEKLIVAENAREKSARFNQLSDWKMFADAENRLMNLSKELSLTRIGEAK